MAQEAMESPVDVTDGLADMKPENRVFRTAAGDYVKIKTWQVPSLQIGTEQYFMSGSLADAAGKALVEADGAPAIAAPQGFGLTFLDQRDTRSREEMIRARQVAYALDLERVHRARKSGMPAGVVVVAASARELRAQIAQLRAPAVVEVAAEVKATRAKGHAMPLLEDGESARKVLRTLERELGFDALPEDLQTGLLATATAFSPVDAIVQTAELIYARRAEVTGSLLALGAGLSALAATHGWQGLGVDRRGAQITMALRREAGEAHPIEGLAWPDPSEDPDPLPHYVAVSPVADL